MKIIEPSFEILDSIDGEKMLKDIELIGRVCYKSEHFITEDSAKGFIKRLLDSKHESVIEHAKLSVKVICDRGVTHEIVRHRIASYSQESTRYCNYFKEKFGKELTLIKPYYWNSDAEKYKIWCDTMSVIEENYNKLIDIGAKPEEARSILPNSLKSEIVMTMNLREWRHFFILRISEKSHPQMREIAKPMLDKFKELIPVVFDDIN